MRIKFKEVFRKEFPKKWYEVIAMSIDMNFFKVINEQGEGEWCGAYMIEDVEKYTRSSRPRKSLGDINESI